MAQQLPVQDQPEGGRKVAFGIIGFIVGLFALLWILKIALGM